MAAETRNILNRRLFLGGAATLVTAAAIPASAQSVGTTEIDTPVTSAIRNNHSGFRMLNWQDYFPNTKNGVILADLASRAVHYWSEDLTIYKLYPSSVPISEELTRRGTTEVIKKVENPTWTPTVDQRRLHPDWPDQVPGGSPDNPLGVRALYLSWPAYRVHGTHDTRKIGRKSSDGCIGLYNEMIAELFDLCPIGTQVRVI